MKIAREGKYQIWEIILLFLATSTLIGAFGVYTSGISIRKYLFKDDGADLENRVRVGTLAKVKGKVMRQSPGDTSFTPERDGAPILDRDTLMTGSDSSAVVELSDGGVIELAPSTLVIMSFEEQVSLADGIAGRAYIEVATGNVSGRAESRKIIVKASNKEITIAKEAKSEIKVAMPKLSEPKAMPAVVVDNKPVAIATPDTVIPSEVAVAPTQAISAPTPSPSPSASPSPSPTLPPLTARLLAPTPGAKLRGRQGPPVKVRLQWEVSDPRASMHLVIRDASNTVFDKDVDQQAGKGANEVELKQPGTYQLELSSADQARPLTTPVRASFTLEPTIGEVALLPTLVGGVEKADNQYSGKGLKDLSLTFRWNKVPNAKGYELVVKNRAGQVLSRKKLDETQYTFRAPNLLKETYLYGVNADLGQGFRASSREESFQLTFRSPNPSFPLDQAEVSASGAAQGNKGGILFAWQKTDFTEQYIFELATDESFGQIVKNAKVKENFLLFRNLKPGLYHWRVRAQAAETVSEPGRSFKITVTP